MTPPKEIEAISKNKEDIKEIVLLLEKYNKPPCILAVISCELQLVIWRLLKQFPAKRPPLVLEIISEKSEFETKIVLESVLNKTVDSMEVIERKELKVMLTMLLLERRMNPAFNKTMHDIIEIFWKVIVLYNDKLKGEPIVCKVRL